MRNRFVFILIRAACWVSAGGLTGCSGMTAVHLSDSSNQSQSVQRDMNDKLWQEHKGWLLSKLPKAVPLAQNIVSALHGTPGSQCSSSDPPFSGCEKLLELVRQKVSPCRLEFLPGVNGQFALVDGDAAYVFRMTDWTLLGIADLSTGLYFTVRDAPLRRSDDRSFAFVSNDETDATTYWTIYRRTILKKETEAPPLGEYSISRSELNTAGVPQQVDLLTVQQRSERELAKQGLSWRRRAQMKAIRMCSSDKQETGNGLSKQGKGKHKHSKSPESATAGSEAEAATTMADALQGKAHLNCKTGSGYVVTEDGIAAEVYRLIKIKDDINAIISVTAKEIPGGIIRYKYPVGQESIDIMNPASDMDMLVQIETTDSRNKLDLTIRADTGISTGTLVLPGDWYLGSGYRVSGKNLSSTEFGAFFIRAYRDCALKDSQGNCKSIPNLLIGFLNPLIAEEFVQYVADHYLGDGKNIEHEIGE